MGTALAIGGRIVQAASTDQPRWVDIVSNLVLPSAAILVSAAVAVWLARRERRDAADERREERRTVAVDRLLDVVAHALLSKEQLSTEEPTRMVRQFWNAVGRLRLVAGAQEPMLLEWLTAEHNRMAMIMVAAKRAADAPPDDPMKFATRPYLLMYWAIVVNSIQEALVNYEIGGRRAGTLTDMRDDAIDFAKDPVAHLSQHRPDAAASGQES